MMDIYSFSPMETKARFLFSFDNLSESLDWVANHLDISLGEETLKTFLVKSKGRGKITYKNVFLQTALNVLD